MIPPDLRHYAAEPRTLDRTMVYEQDRRYKPRGLWVSVPGEDDWPSWCEGERFGLDRLAFEHAVTVDRDANILVLRGPDDLLKFTDKYGVELIPRRAGSSLRSDYIDWPTVTSEYEGIIIAPHVWTVRLDLMWYYGWDCASGCIWDLGAIGALTLTTKRTSE